MPPVQFELDDFEAELIANEALWAAMALEKEAARIQRDHKMVGIPPADDTPIQARVVLLRHFALMVKELVEEARACRPTTS
ncbi:MAG TPA: hypothetical protein VIJ94_11400 [Caulobacteraceae bacterium]